MGMNEGVCRACRRYGGRPKDAGVKGWLCAAWVCEQSSKVVPGFVHYERNMFHPMTEERKAPPEWCERTLEQVILPSEEQVEVRPDVMLVHDGNKAAEHHMERFRYNGPWRVRG